MKKILYIFIGILCAGIALFFIKERKPKHSQEVVKVPTEIMLLKMRADLMRIIEGFGIKEMVQVGNLDSKWIQDARFPLNLYIGIDASAQLIEKMRQECGSSTCRFQVQDISKDLLPKSDLIFCSDALNYFSSSNIRATLVLLKKSASKYLLLNHDVNKEKNMKSGEGVFNSINWQLAPYHFPAPILTVQIGNTTLALWKLEDLP